MGIGGRPPMLSFKSFVLHPSIITARCNSVGVRIIDVYSFDSQIPLHCCISRSIMRDLPFTCLTIINMLVRSSQFCMLRSFIMSLIDD